MMKRLVLATALMLAITASMAQKPLQLNLSKGQTYTQAFSNTSAISQQVQGMSIDVNVSYDSKMTFKVIGLKDSLYTMEVNYLTMKTKVSSQFANMEMNSESTDANDKMSALMKAFTNKPFMATISKTGRVYAIAADSLINAVSKSLESTIGNDKGTLDQIKKTFGSTAIKSTIENQFAFYTGKSEKVGSKWIRSYSVDNGMTILFNNNFEVVSTQGNVYTIKSTGTATTPPGTKMNQGGMEMSISFNGSTEGEIKVDMNSGWIINGAYSQDLKGQAEIAPNAQLPSGMSIPMTINAKGTISQ